MNILKTANNKSPLNAQNPVHLNVQGYFYVLFAQYVMNEHAAAFVQ